MVNEDKIRQLAEHLRRQRVFIEMHWFFNSRGAPSCIAGHAAQLFRPRLLAVGTEAFEFDAMMRQELGLSKRQRDAIMFMDRTADDGVWARVLGPEYCDALPIASLVKGEQAADALLQICGVTP